MSTLRPRSGRPAYGRRSAANRRLAWTGLITVLAMLMTLFPQVVPGAAVPAASAHNLNQTMVYMFFDPDTQKYLDLRAASITPPTPLLEVGKEYGIIIKVIPDQGTNTGVGGYVDFYVPNGTQVTDVGYILPGDNATDGITVGWDKVPMKGQALMPDVGAGGESNFDLTGISRTNPFGVTSTVVNSSNANLGTLPAIYGDTGIFYSTIPETAWGSYSNGQVIDQVNKLVNNSGDTVGYRTVLKGILNEWDAWQMAAYGLASTNNAAYPANAIIDSNERGYTPWGMANMVPGPQSGYAWEFDKDVWDSNSAVTPLKNRADLAWQVGPWNRIKYPGSQFATDPPGHRGATIHAVGGNASNLGASMPLPATTGQANGTPNAVRWAVGQLTYNTPEYVWVKIKVNDLAAIMNSSGCPIFNADSIGGDAGGDSGGKDHIWRYYDPTDFQWNGCLALGKPATKEVVRVGDNYQYKIKMYNAGNNDFANAVIQDTLGSGVTYISASPAPSVVTSTTLQWNVSPFLRGQMFEATVTVKASSTGLLDNKVCTVGTVSSGPAGAGSTVSTCSGDTTPSGQVPLFKQGKTVNTTSIAPGGSVQWTIDIQNIGTGASGTPIKIEDHVPAGFTYQSLNSVLINGASVTGATTVSGTPQDPIFSVPYPLQPGQKLLITFTAVSDPNINPGSYCNYYTNYAPAIPLTTGLLACVSVGGGAIGDTVWRDWNGNGTQDTGEEGLPGVDVKLYSGACGPSGSAIQTKTTDANGFYRFTGLTNGDYCVDVPASGAAGGAPSGYTLTTANDPKTVTLTAANPQDYTVDFGYKPGGTGSIGDTVFEDKNNNGVFDGIDVGITGAQVILYEDTNGNGILDAGSDVQVATTTTGAGGLYSFTGLATGISYLVYVDPADTAVDNQFAGPYVASTPDPQPVPNLSGAYDAADIGFWAVQPGSIGDQVFLDNNKNGIYDAGDLPIPNVTVDLYLDGALLKSTTSDATGKYLFEDLGAGNYTVVVNAADPDVPAGYLPSIIKIDKVLAPNETYLNADFPFVAGLGKTVDKNYAATGTVLNFSLKPYYPGSELLSDVRVIDPLPTGTTYVNNSANATGGAFGAYQFFAAVPGQDTGGGPAGTATLDTAITVGSNYVVKGGSVSVTLNVKSSAAVSVVSPGPLTWTGGSATCTGPTPTSGNVPSGGSGLNFVWSCALNDIGEYVFSADAADASGDWAWPSADSASVLSSPGGGPNVVTWNLGSNTPGVPGENLVSGSLAGIYAFRGGNTKEFSSYNTAWLSKAQPTNGIEKGGSLTGDGAGTLWALEGNSKIFYKYDVATNAWTRLADTSDNANEGGSVQYLSVAGTKYVYALLGNSNRFRRYAVVGNTWSNMVNTLASVKKGGSLATDGTYLYALQGDTKTGFWRCDATTDNVAGACSGASGSWTSLASTPGGVGWGGSLTRLGNYLYATQGNGKKAFWRCNFTTTGTAGSCNTSWSVLASAPGNMADGGRTTTDGTYIYALQGKTKTFWRYDPATNTWATLPSVNFTGNVGQGGALAYDPGSSPVGYFSTAFASPSLVSTGDKIKVTLNFYSQTAVNSVVPSSLTVTPTGGASAACGSPTLISPDANVGGPGDPAIYEWTCTATAGATPGSLTFSASATGSGGATYPSAASKSVLVSPTLTFQATVAAGAPAVVENTGILLETSGTFDALPSNTTQTGTGGSIGDTVWLDLNGNGTQDTGEVGQAGVRVYIDANNNNQYDAGELNDVTDANGLYRIFGLAAGTYNVRIDTTTLPANYTPTTATQKSVTIVANEQYNDADFGIRPPGTASIGDTVWLDYNRDNVQDTGEPGLPNINVWLYDDKNNNGSIDVGDVLLKQTTTNANGNYTFTGLYGGNYLVDVNPQGTDKVQSPYGGLVNLSGLYFVPGTDPHDVTLSDGQAYTTADFGYDWNSSIGDFVWWDVNANGVYDSGEAPIQGAQVLLYWDVANNNKWDPGDPYIDQALTDASGIYHFTDLPPGNYVLEVYEDSFTVGGNREAIPSTPDWQTVDLGANQNYVDADWGYYDGALIEGYVFHDDNRDGVLDNGEAPLPNVTVTLTGTDSNGNPVNLTTTSDSTGYFKFVVPEGTYTVSYNTGDVDIPPALSALTTPVGYNFVAQAGPDYHYLYYFGRDNNGKIGNLVWNDANGDGSKGGSEPGLPGVTVRLYRASDNTLIDTVATDANGEYWFTGVPDGAYVVKVDAATLPAGYTQTGDPDPTKDNQGSATITSGNTVDTMDFGYKPPANTYTVTGTVWEDTNGDGVKNEAPRIPGVTVCLYTSPAATLVACTTTLNDGTYSFPGIPNGDYIVRVNPSTLPSPAYVQTGDPDALKDNQTPVTVNNGNPPAKDFGYQQQLGSISGTVCLGNGNGTCDAGEGGITPVPVTLQYAGPDGLIGTPDDPAPVTVFTDANGNYTFPNLVPGVYQITETNLPGYISVADTDGGNPDVIGVTVAANQAIADRDFEDKLPAQVSGTVFDDLNLNGQQDPGEAGISGVTVTLKQGATTIATTTTNGLGEYEFTGLAAGSNYTIVETQPAGWISTKDADLGDPDQIGPFSLASGQNLTDRDFGEAKYGSISGRVCVDANNNGQCEAGETGISGVQVCAAAGLCGTTDGTGNYTIPNVPPGNYTVTESQPAGYTSSSPDTLPVTVPSGQAVPNVNYAEVTPVNNTFSISGTVCANVNGDGVCDPGEVPLPGVTVQLYDRQGALVATTTTNAAGDYTFPNVPKGDYTVAELDLPNYFSVNDAVSPNDNAIPVTVNNANVTDRDFVDAPAPGKLSGMVFEDLNLNGQRDAGEPGISNVTVSLNTGATAITNANGYYEFVSLPPATYTITESDPSGYISTGDVDGANDNKIVATVPAGGSVTDRDFGDAKLGSINGTVWNDVDKDGIQDPGEAGLPNVVVCATPTSGGAPVCDVTDGNGNYNLPNLPPGSYVVTETDPAGYTSTTPNSVPVNLGSGQNTDSPDFGDVLNDPTLGSIAGTVCKNVNSNGVCGDVAGETGLPGVTVQLYQGNTLIRTTTTDALGNYLFDNLPAANDYNVREVNPTGYTSVTDADGNTNGADKIDPVAVNGNSVVDRDFIDTPTPSAISGKVCDDTNRNGVCDAGEPGIGGVTVTLYDSNGNPTTKTTAGDGTYSFPNLPPDTYTIVETDKPGYQSTGDVYGLNDNTIVVPLAPGSTVANQNFADAPIPGGISGTVYNDLNGDGNFDPGEPGLVGVKVCLTPPGDPAGCTTTDAQGRYSFSNLTPGNYTVTETDPSGYTSTGDADGNGNTFNVIAVTVPSGVTVTEQNFFDYARQALPSVSVIKTLKDTPASVRIGQKVTYNIAIQNTGNVAITVLPLVDTYNTTFLTYGYPPALYATPASNDNVNDGTINWTDLTVSFGQDLAPGQTWNVEVVFTAREDTSTIANTGKTDNTAIIQGALAGNDQVPTQSSTVPIEILRTTGVQVTGFAAAVSQGVIQISWDTADETRILGFNLYRVGERGTIEPVNGDLIFAQHAGQGAGDHYSILDTLQPGAVYRLEVVRLDGSAVVFGDTKVVAP